MSPAAHRPRPRAAAFLPSLAAALLATGLGLAPDAGAAPATKAKAAAPQKELEAKQADLSDLRGKIDGLKKDLARTEESRADVADQLKASEQEISKLSARLRDLASQRSRVEGELAALSRESRDLEGVLTRQQAALATLLQREYQAGRLQADDDALRLLLRGEDPNQLSRDFHYLGALAQARRDWLGQMESTLQRKKSLADDTRERAAELAKLEDSQREEQAKLAKERQARQAKLDALAQKVSARRKELGSLARDEQQLSRLVTGLNRVIAQQAAQEAARRKAEEEARKREQAKAAASAKANNAAPGRPPRGSSEEKPPRRAAELANTREPEALGGSGSFASLRGSLRLPVRGSVVNRYGASRPEGGSWKGLFIRAGGGSEVKAVAPGRVVFADWMRGFGNLLIVDHGGTYLTIYGNNEALLKKVGDAVKSGDPVATVGNSGGNPETGLYFELRYQGQPQDPLRWVNLR
ncbi:M23 family peptidase [Oryzomicrobium terrae]|uniref:M23 family peptidase n=1 Tax=Oryzomicrobium terrae TaxID=1735038 RepID=A0A5C1E515_9RHOO|nr:peptidoglycan DD-metalloendopeptidase family protein [Oryzomicrobium terrae]QEL63970.1 M23 family peptidase [Oryzomicrobium terrae]